MPRRRKATASSACPGHIDNLGSIYRCDGGCATQPHVEISWRTALVSLERIETSIRAWDRERVWTSPDVRRGFLAAAEELRQAMRLARQR